MCLSIFLSLPLFRYVFLSLSLSLCSNMSLYLCLSPFVPICFSIFVSLPLCQYAFLSLALPLCFSMSFYLCLFLCSNMFFYLSLSFPFVSICFYIFVCGSSGLLFDVDLTFVRHDKQAIKKQTFVCFPPCLFICTWGQKHN
jgi:hypothetical protein